MTAGEERVRPVEVKEKFIINYMPETSNEYCRQTNMEKFMKLTKLLFLSLTLVCSSIMSAQNYHKEDLGYGTWSKSWFADEFGDPMYDKPYIQTELRKKYSQETFDYFYIRFLLYNGQPAYEIIISHYGVTGHSNYDLYGDDASIKIKSSNGSVTAINGRVSGGNIYLAGNEAIKFARTINAGNYKLSVAAHCYLDEYGKATTWNFSCTNETRDFFKAAKAGLNYSFQGNTGNSSSPRVASSGWAGKYEIEGGIYRTTDVKADIVVKSAGNNTYTGTIGIFTDECWYGWMNGKIKGTIENGVLTLTLVSQECNKGEGGNYINTLRPNTKIGTISKAGSTYKFTPLNGAKKIFEPEMGIKIKKVQ